MDRRRIVIGRAGAAAVPAGLLVGTAAVVLAGTAVAHRLAADASRPLLEATHLPMLLTDGSRPVELRYDVYCSSGDETDAADECDVAGSVFVRWANARAYEAVPLRADPTAPEGRWVARVSDDVARSRSGFSYYATFTSASAGLTVTLPAGGAAAPQQSVPLLEGAVVSLGRHEFGRSRAADARVAEARWGSAAGEVGLEEGRNLSPIGGASFDVDATGTVHVLDEANRRVLRWSRGDRTPDHTPLAIRGTLADLTVAEDGATYVLETTAEPGRAPLLLAFGPGGALRASIEIPERSAVVRMGPNGPVTLQQPSGQWMRATVGGRPLGAAEQQRSGRSGRPLPGGGEVVVLRTGDELRVAVVGRDGIRRGWRITSDTPLAEVQLAEPLGNRLVVVVRAYTDTRSEFVVLVLDRDGLADRFSLDAADWAETAPLSRFRLVGSSLYRLGSTPHGMFVDRFDLEVS